MDLGNFVFAKLTLEHFLVRHKAEDNCFEGRGHVGIGGSEELEQHIGEQKGVDHKVIQTLVPHIFQKEGVFQKPIKNLKTEIGEREDQNEIEICERV